MLPLDCQCCPLDPTRVLALDFQYSPENLHRGLRASEAHAPCWTLCVIGGFSELSTLTLASFVGFSATAREAGQLRWPHWNSAASSALYRLRSDFPGASVWATSPAGVSDGTAGREGVHRSLGNIYSVEIEI